MIVQRVKCDNPKCKSVETLENIEPFVPPYGWFSIEATVIGCGPHIVVDVCKPECAKAAIYTALENYYAEMNK